MSDGLTDAQRRAVDGQIVRERFPTRLPNTRWMVLVGTIALSILVRMAIWDHQGRSEQVWPDVLGPLLVASAVGIGCVMLLNRFRPMPAPADVLLTDTHLIAPNGSRLELSAITRIKRVKSGIRVEGARYADGLTMLHLSDPLATTRGILARVPEPPLPH